MAALEELGEKNWAKKIGKLKKLENWKIGKSKAQILGIQN